VAIVGAGASGTLVAIQLLRSAHGPLEVLLVEKERPHGLGAAYSTTHELHILNVPAGNMSALPDQPGHFLAWAKAQDPSLHEGSFARRELYGRYLRSLLGEAEGRARPQVSLIRRTGEVTSLRRGRDLWELSFGEGSPTQVHAVVLAMGNDPPAQLPVPDGGLYQSPRYHAMPWGGGAFAGFAPGDSVLVLGAGLTAVDTLAALWKAGVKGPFYVLSRHGLLPRVHASSPPPPKPQPAPGRVELRPLLREVRRAAEAREGSWHPAVDCLRADAQARWSGLALSERRRFLRHVRPFWDVHRHRMAPEMGRLVEQLRESGALTVVAGRLQSFRLVGEGVEATFRPRGGREDRMLRVHRVVNCTGPYTLLQRSTNPLTQSLLASGLARPDELGMTYDANEEGTLLNREGLPQAGLYALGPLLRGGLWESVAIPEIRVQAERLAQRLLDATISARL
jgi:uncharacterized NAD(P)/FAD-binding protein YdhS